MAVKWLEEDKKSGLGPNMSNILNNLNDENGSLPAAFTKDNSHKDLDGTRYKQLMDNVLDYASDHWDLGSTDMKSFLTHIFDGVLSTEEIEKLCRDE